MIQDLLQVPAAVNEPVLSYKPGSPEYVTIKNTLNDFLSKEIEIPMFIGGKEVRTGNRIPITMPHNHKKHLGYYYRGDKSHVQMAIDEALKARKEWARMDWRQRASILLRAASLISDPYRARINAATMLGQSKSLFQSELDAACEIVDFFRYNVQFMAEIYSQQPRSSHHTWNRLEQRPLEGFVFALSPFNFTSIAANLPTAPALMGNTVVWKPSNTQIYSANILMEVYREAGFPAGVINLVFVPGPVAGDVIFKHPDFAGIHYTGSTEVFQNIWKQIGENIGIYKSYPRIVGETGGKDFVMVHESAHPQQVVTALILGAFDYQGQKCSAASRAYVPDTLWPAIRKMLVEQVKTIRMGDPVDFSNFMNAVIDEPSFDKLAGVIEKAKKDEGVEIITGGGYDKSVGYFIEPTILLVKDPNYPTMHEELFGPILSVYVYNAKKYAETLDLVDNTSIYALTGSIMAQDRTAIDLALDRLVNAAGNFYINDKPTGAIVGMQPFGGARKSGTNDKAGSLINLLRWVSPRAIKENYLPPEDYRHFIPEEG